MNRPAQPHRQSQDVARVELDVEGMTCAACVARVEGALRKASGVLGATVNLAAERAVVEVERSALSVPRLAGAVADAGFAVGRDTVSLPVEGMTCSACANRVEQALRQVAGVFDAQVNLALERAEVSFARRCASPERLAEAVDHAGYRAILVDDRLARAEDRQQALLDKERRIALVSAALTAPLVISMALAALGYEDLHVMPAAEVLLATPVQFLIGLRFYRGALNALRGGVANMDVLVALGTTAAYCYSWYLLQTLGEQAQGRLYFEASAVIITLVLVGKYLEGRAKRGATAALRGLMALRPDTACVETPDGAQTTVRVDAVQPGDLVVVRPGGRVPVDGKVAEGESEVDESLVTGESMPVRKGPGVAVTGGSVNGVGLLKVYATAVGEDSTLARIIRLVENAQAGKASVQRLVDRISAIFVPCVVAIAAVTFGGWLFISANFEQALIAAVSVLVIACPCALGLATPTAILTGTGAAARAGILIKDIDVLERAHRIDAVVFDKTGTLTAGCPQVVAARAADAGGHGASRRAPLDGSGNADAALRLAAAVQQGSEHLLARATLEYAAERQLRLPPVERFEATPGQGVRGVVEGRNVAVGNAGFVAASAALGNWAKERESAGETVAFVAGDDALLGAIAFADPLRDHAADAVRLLQRIEVTPMLLSGDAPAVAERVGRELGLSQVRGGVRPEAKAQAVREMTNAGQVVAMVGDGVNDAPALATADVGIAMGSGTDIAMQTAGITLMRPDPRLVAGAVAASRATFRKVRQNLFWAFIYNIVCIPLAAAGYLSPTLAAAAMALSSVSVVCSSLWLLRWRPSLNLAPA